MLTSNGVHSKSSDAANLLFRRGSTVLDRIEWRRSWQAQQRFPLYCTICTCKVKVRRTSQQAISTLSMGILRSEHGH